MRRATKFFRESSYDCVLGLWEALGLLTWFCFCVCLLGFKRYVYPFSPPRYFLVNNLLAGSVPCLLSLFTLPLGRTRGNFKAKRYIYFLLFVSWLIFLPNSLYLFTDIVHLQDLKSYSFYTLESLSFPYWLDLIIFINFSLLSYYFGLLSIFQWHTQLLSCPRLIRGPLLLLSFFCAGTGVYLGRFIRLFSWEALTNLPFIIHEINTLLTYPYALIFSLILSLGYFISYWVIFLPRIKFKQN